MRRDDRQFCDAGIERSRDLPASRVDRKESVRIQLEFRWHPFIESGRDRIVNRLPNLGIGYRLWETRQPVSTASGGNNQGETVVHHSTAQATSVVVSLGMIDQIPPCASPVTSSSPRPTTRCNAGELASHPIEVLAQDWLRADRLSGTLVQRELDLFARARTGASMLRERSTLREAALAARSKGTSLAGFNLLSRQS